MTLPTPRQRIVHPIRMASPYVGAVESFQLRIMANLVPVVGADGVVSAWGLVM